MSEDGRIDQSALPSSASTPTRSASTETHYRRRFHLLWGQFAAGKPIHDPLDITAYADWLISRRSDLSASSFRQYRSTSTFVIADRLRNQMLGGDEREDGLQALQILQASQSQPAVGSLGSRVRPKTMPGRTSAKKAKSVRWDDWDQLMAVLTLSRSQHARSISLLLVAGLFTGLRPSEWKSAHLMADQDSGAWRLTVANGKLGNGRAHGPARTLTWPEASCEVDAIASWLTHLDQLLPSREDERDREWNVLYKALRDELHQITLRLWPRRKRHITFYTTRHLFVAAAKDAFLSAACSREELAALLGHATDATATMHYARASKGSKAKRPFTLPVPDPSEVVRVRQVFEAREAKATYRVLVEEGHEIAMRPLANSP
ncbi:MAG: hypothetical protein ABW179_02580 [Methylobacterium sp.]